MSTCSKAEEALQLLRTSSYHLVILDVQPRDNDNFTLLEKIGLEMELPVVLGACVGASPAQPGRGFS